MARSDPLIYREVIISADATAKGGKQHPQAGQRGTVIAKTPGGRQYQIRVGDTLTNLPLDAFEVVEQHAGPQQAVIKQPTILLVRLAPSRTNRPVVEDDDLYEMAATMKIYGVLQPLLTRRLPGDRLQDTFETAATRQATHEIIAGERRYRAAQIAGLREVPHLEKDADNQQALLMQLIENLHRRDLNALEEAQGVQHLVEEHGYTPEAAAEALRKSRSHVFESLRLLTLCPEAMAALKAGTLKRSVALLVAQRPTQAMQAEFTNRVLTGGPEDGPMSYRSALDLARRNYMTKLDQAPFALDDVNLCPTAGACTMCPKRTSATPELWDKNDADVCTDTACFAEKKDAHFDRVKADAAQRGQQIITGRAARDIMPSETGSPRGYILLDKPSQGSKAPVRQVLGQEVSAASVVLIEAPSGNLVEAVPTHAASAAVKAKVESQSTKKANSQKPVDPTRDELETEYQKRWRKRAVEATILGLANCPPEDLDHIPSNIALLVLKQLATSVPREQLFLMFQIPLSDPRAEVDLDEAMESASEQELPTQLQFILQLASTQDLEPRPNGQANYLEELHGLAGVSLAAIQKDTQDAMKKEAAARAGKSQPADTVQPKLKKNAKASAEETTRAIAEAMSAAEADSPKAFTPGQQVRIRVDLRGPGKKLLATKGRIGMLTQQQGERAWMLELSKDPNAQPEDMVERWALSADYTELETIDLETAEAHQ